MGDRGGRFGGRRGGGGGGGGRIPIGDHPERTVNRNNVWQREHPVGSGGSQGTGSERREFVTHREDLGAGKDKLPATNREAGRIPSAPEASAASRAIGTASLCMNCEGEGHLTARCPTVRCERCGKLGHMAQICQAMLPWDCIAAMCGFQAPGQGFFYFPDSSPDKQVKERASSLVISVLEGRPTDRKSVV